MKSFETEKEYVGEGWQPLVETLNKKLLALDPNYEILQIKEKFGGLRYYIAESDNMTLRDKQAALINEAENVSFTICEYCGEPGTADTTPPGRWLKTMCEACRTP